MAIRSEAVEVDVVSLAAEFPNDNPSIHRGVSWICVDPTGAAVAVREAVEVVEVRAIEVAALESVEVAAVEAEVVVEADVPVARVSGFVALGEGARIEKAEGIGDDRESGELEEFLAEEIVVEEMPALDETASLEGVIAMAEVVAIPEVASIPQVATGAEGAACVKFAARVDVAGIEEIAAGVESAVSAEVAVSEEVAVSVELPVNADVVVSVEVEHDGATAPAIVTVSATIVPPPPDDPFTTLLSALTDVAMSAGSPAVAALLPGLLLHGRLDQPLTDDATRALEEANVLRGSEITSAFIAQARAWHAILLGTSDDFSACGNAMLDEWAADLLARLLGAATRATPLRRELRSRGVAAFGLVDVAA